MSNHKTYLDYSATTPLDPRVLDTMLPYFSGIFGNPSSVHTFGQKAENAIETAREQMAVALNCSPNEIYFTSGGTESDNWALIGGALAAREARGAKHVLISPVEHEAVTQAAERLHALYDFELEFLPVDEFGMVHAEAVAARLRPDTALVSVVYGNNEVGTINPLAEIGAVCRAAGVTLHTDAVQAGAYLSLDVDALHVDMMSLGAHKFYGPKGVGALYVRKGTPLQRGQVGGAHENAMRAGTSNVPYVVGMAEALTIAQREQAQHNVHLQTLRDQLITSVLDTVETAQLTGHPSQRLPHHASFVFRGVDGNNLLMMLDVAGFACSSGSACKTGLPEPSSVLTAMGYEPQWALGSLRVTLGRATTNEEIDKFIQTLQNLLASNSDSR